MTLPKSSATKPRQLSPNPVAQAALDELHAWLGLTETSAKADELLRKYWRAAGLAYPGPLVAWSGVFVLYCANKGAPGSLDGAGAGSHMLYASRGLSAGPGEYHTRRPDIAPSVGDIILRQRGSTKLVYEQIGRGHVPSHGDIVTRIEGSTCFVVGGNLSNTVEERSYALNMLGLIEPKQGVVALLTRA